MIEVIEVIVDMDTNHTRKALVTDELVIGSMYAFKCKPCVFIVQLKLMNFDYKARSEAKDGVRKSIIMFLK